MKLIKVIATKTNKKNYIKMKIIMYLNYYTLNSSFNLSIKTLLASASLVAVKYFSKSFICLIIK